MASDVAATSVTEVWRDGVAWYLYSARTYAAATIDATSVAATFDHPIVNNLCSLPNEENGTANLSTGDVEIPKLSEERNGLTIFEEIGDKDDDQTNQSNTQTGHGKVKREKPSSSKRVVATLEKKNKDGKHGNRRAATINGSVQTTSHLKKPLAVATNRGSSEERKGVESNVITDYGKENKSTSAPTTAWNTQALLHHSELEEPCLYLHSSHYTHIVHIFCLTEKDFPLAINGTADPGIGKEANVPISAANHMDSSNVATAAALITTGCNAVAAKDMVNCNAAATLFTTRSRDGVECIHSEPVVMLLLLKI